MNKLNIEYLKIIYKGFIQKKSVKQLGKELYDLTINSNELNYKGFDECIELVNQIKRKMPKDNYLIQVVMNKYPKYVDSIKSEVDAIAIMVFGLLDTTKAYSKLKKEMYRRANEVEEEEKIKEIGNSVEENRENEIVFYLMSSHLDCALDHANYQGRIYFDEKWEEIIKDEEVKEKVRDYIKKNNLKSFQWVVGSPVYLITRPNCRHYFKKLSVKEVLGNSNNALIKKYHLTRPIGDRQYMQTMSVLKDETRVVIGEYRNAEIMLERYKERLEYHKSLYKISRNDFIKDAIVKDKFLIGKWQKYLRMYKGD